MSRAVVTVTAFTLALALRILNVHFAAVPPTDELYHWKRIAFSAQHFPQVLELDPDRGVDGAFCPWPPLYDLGAGGIARLFGMDSVPWIPPIAGALAVAAAALWLATRFGLVAGWTGAIALASSPFIVTQSWIGAIDHHFLEWPLVFAMVIVSGAPESGAKRNAMLGIAMLAAIFVQTALILACALLCIVFWFRGDRSASGAFFASAAVVAIYRLTRTAGYPDSAWFLGWPHVILLVAAGVALLVRPRLLGLACGIAIASFAPVMHGLHFLGGDPWLRTIIEFQPMWRSHGADLLSQIAGLGAGAILVWTIVRKQPAIALFTIAFLILTIINRRFWSVSIPLLAIAGSVAVSFSRAKVKAVLALAVAAVPAMQLAAWMRHPPRPVERYEVAWIDAAKFLRTRAPGRVLAPWPMGHAFDVIGRHGVIIDGFGTMPDAANFWRATAALDDPRLLAPFCAAAHVQYVVTAAGQRLPPGFRPIYRSDPRFYRAALIIWQRDA